MLDICYIACKFLQKVGTYYFYNEKFFATLVKKLTPIPSVCPKLLTLNQERPSKKLVFPFKFLYKTEVMITSLMQC